MNIEGKNAVKQALLSDLTITKILVDKNYSSRKDELLELASKKKIKIEFLPKQILDKKSQTAHHQGFIAISVDFQFSSLDELMQVSAQRNQPPFFVLLDGIEDPHNFGAIIRSCECAGVHGIIIPKNRACQVNETVIKTSTGAISNMKICQVTNLKEAIDFLKENGVWIFAAEANGESIYSKKLPSSIAIIIGSEGKGVRPSIIAHADGVVSLPVMGKVNSLNASVACGVVIFEILRQRRLNEI